MLKSANTLQTQNKLHNLRDVMENQADTKLPFILLSTIMLIIRLPGFLCNKYLALENYFKEF